MVSDQLKTLDHIEFYKIAHPFASNYGVTLKSPEIVKVLIFKLLSHYILIYLPTVRHWVEMLKFSNENTFPHKNRAATTQAQLYSSRS